MTGTVAEIEVPFADFALGETFARLDGLRCEIERVIAHGGDRVLPFVWVSDGGQKGETAHDADDVAAALTADPGVASFELCTDLDDERLYRMEWTDRVHLLVQVLVEENGTVLSASGEAGTWALRLFFPEHEALSRTNEYCEANDLGFDVRRIYQLDDGRKGRYGLTDKQQEALAVAFERGYYEIPRAIDAQDLAEELAISHQALSELLRRGHESLVKNTVVIGKSIN